jgi:hypothetical protein
VTNGLFKKTLRNDKFEGSKNLTLVICGVRFVFQEDSMAPINRDSRMSFPLQMRGALPALIKVAALVFLLVLVSNCATQKIVGNEFVHSHKGYAFALPAVDWEIDEDAWRDERDFGYILVKSRPKTRLVRKPRDRSNPKRNELEFRPVPKKKIEKLLLDMDVGFRHKTHAGTLRVGTIIEGRLIKFIKGNFPKTDSDLPENLIRGYMERLRDFYPPRNVDPKEVTARTLAQPGQVYRMEWIEGRDLRILYGVSLYKEFLFMSFNVDREATPSVIEEGSNALDQLVESVVISAVK